MTTTVATPAPRAVDPYEALCALRQVLIDDNQLSELIDVLEQHHRAAGYVEGWQDRAGERDDLVSWNFGIAYAIQAAEFALGRRHTYKPIVRAFQDWLEYGELR